MISATGENDDLLIIKEKYGELTDSIRKLGKAAIAFSGGVDSSLLAYAAKETLGDNACAFTLWSPLLPADDKRDILSFTDRYGIRLFKIEHNDLSCKDFCENSPERCYICKSARLDALTSLAEELDIPWLLDGSNIDDLNDWRPGMKAVRESKITLSPLLECGLSKKDIREISSHLELPTAVKPSAACLASRIPTGTAITEELILKIDAGEDIIKKYLPANAQLRMRYDGRAAKIETDRENIPGLSQSLALISEELALIGIAAVLIEKDGYMMGSATVRPK